MVNLQVKVRIPDASLTIELYFPALHLRYASDMRTLSVEPKNRPYLVNYSTVSQDISEIIPYLKNMLSKQINIVKINNSR